MPLKIAHISPVYPPYAGGIGVVAQMMAEGLAARGWEVGIFTPNVGALESNARTNGKTRLVPLKPWLHIGNAAMAPQLRTLEGYDIIHLHYPFFGGAEWLLFNKSVQQKKIKFILQYHHDADANGLKGAIFKLYDTLVLPQLMKRADKVIVSSMDYARNSHVANFISEKFVEIPLGVDTERFNPNGAPFKLPDSQFTILFVGSLDRAHWFKGLDVLLYALKVLKQKNTSSWQCNIVGDGDLRPRYERQARDLGMVDKIEFLGNVPHEQLSEVYRTADVFVFPSVSRAEAFGLVVLEAMASGLPVVVSDLPGVRTLIQCHGEPDEPCGSTFSIGDSSKLSELILKMMHHEALRKRIGEAARNRVLARYTMGSTIDHIERIYESLTH